MATDPKPVVTGYPAAEHSYPAANQAGAAYPYPAPPYYPAQPPPPPQPYYGASYYPNYDNNSRRFLRRLVIAGIAVFVLIGFVTFITWLVLRPRLPIFSISAASVSSFNVNSSSSQQLSSNFDVTLDVTNPNKKMSLYYDSVEASVLYGLDTISVTSLPPFYQGKGNSTVIPAKFSAVSDYLGSDAARGILQDKANGAVNFNVRVFAWVEFKSGAWRTRKHTMRVYCDDVRIGFSNSTASSGSLVGPSKQCQVYL